MSLRRWGIFLACGVLAALSLTAAGTWFLAWHKSRESKAQAWANYAAASASQIRVRARDLLAWVEGLAADPKLLQALAEVDGDKAEAQRLARLIPEAVKVQILPKLKERWKEIGPELGFADLDLVHQAETGAPPPAVHGAGSPDQRLAVARAIKQENRVVGVILVNFSLDWLQSALPAPASGAIGLYQGELRLAYQGEAVFKDLPPSGIVPIPDTLWQIKYWIPPSEWTDFLGGAAILVVALIITGLMFGWVLRKLIRAIDQDRTTLFVLARDLVAGTMQGNYSLILQELIPLRDRLLELERLEVRTGPEVPVVTEALPETKLEASDVEAIHASPLPPKATATVAVPESIFRPEDIRGIVGETLTSSIAYELGRAIGSEVGALGEQSLVVGCDARPSSEELTRALIEGLRASGRDVIDLGRVPTPLVYFATHYLPVHNGVVVTGGHDSSRYNGLKIVVGQELWCDEKLAALQRRIKTGDFASGLGMLEARDLLADYIGAVLDDVQIGRPLKVIIDCGAGAAVQVAPALLRTLGCEVEESPSRDMLDPFAPGALDRLCAKVQKDPEAELGLAFDGDGDRLAVIDSSGSPVPPDVVLMLLAADVLSRAPGGDIVFDLECSRHLAGHIVQHGGRPVAAASSLLRAKMIEVGAVLGGSFGGHLLFPERWFGFADAIYGAARLLEVLSAEPSSSAEVFSGLPKSPATPRLEVDLAQGESDKIMRLLSASADKFFHDAKINPQGGVRVDFADGWGLVRASPSGALVFRFEADDGAALVRIQARFREWFRTLEIAVELPFAVMS